MPMPTAKQWGDFLREIDRIKGSVDEIDHLAKKALDLESTLEERRTSAMIACERMERIGLFKTLRKALAWVEENRGRFETATSGLAFLGNLLGGSGRR